MVRTGNQCKQPVPVFGRDAGIVRSIFLKIGHGFLKISLVLSIDELVELKTVLVFIVYPVIEGSYDLIFPLLIQRGEPDRRMLLPILFLSFHYDRIPADLPASGKALKQAHIPDIFFLRCLTFLFPAQIDCKFFYYRICYCVFLHFYSPSIGFGSFYFPASRQRNRTGY